MPEGKEFNREYKVYYAKNPRFREDGKITRLNVLNERTHAHIKTVEMSGLEEIYRRFQALPPEFGTNSVWLEENVAADNAMLDSKGLSHTSMSVGDCVLDVDVDTLYECASCGWNVVEE